MTILTKADLIKSLNERLLDEKKYPDLSNFEENILPFKKEEIFERLCSRILISTREIPSLDYMSIGHRLFFLKTLALIIEKIRLKLAKQLSQQQSLKSDITATINLLKESPLDLKQIEEKLPKLPVRFQLRFRNVSSKGKLDKAATDSLIIVLEQSLGSLSLESIYESSVTRNIDLKKLLNVLQFITLITYSNLCNEDLKKLEGPVRIIHFYEETGSPRASEHLASSAKFMQTNHGIGSGIYGLSALKPNIIFEQIDKKSNYEIITINKPLRLVSQLETDQYKNCSLFLMQVVDRAKQILEETKYPCEILDDENLKSEYRIFLLKASLQCEDINNFIIDDFLETQQDLKPKLRQVLYYYACLISKFNALEKTSMFYRNKKLTFESYLFNVLEIALINFQMDSIRDLFPMPINYVVRDLQYSGVVSIFNNEFWKGLIAMEKPQEKNIKSVPVKNIKVSESDEDLTKLSVVELDYNSKLGPIHPVYAAAMQRGSSIETPEQFAARSRFFPKPHPQVGLPSSHRPAQPAR